LEVGGNERFQKTLAARQERFLAALMASNSLAEAARTVGIAETTARRWLAQPPVREQYRALRREAVESTMAQVQASTAAAAVTLRRLLHTDMPPAIRLRAALGILEQAVKMVETTDILERLEQLEAAAAAQRAQSTGRTGRGGA
jgi:hypothetical protein